GAGPRGPLEAELTRSHGHALVVGPSGTGKTELLRSLAASLSAGGRPDRLHLVLLDGDGSARDGLRTCLELPHARHHLAASDPVEMREFAQSLSGELKRRAELIGDESTYEEFARGASRPGHRVVPPRNSPHRDGARTGAEAVVPERVEQQTADPSATGSGQGPETVHGTLRLRTTQAQTGGTSGSSAGRGTEPAGRDVPAATDEAFVQHLDAQSAPVPRLVILVDDFDTLVDPALGNPGRPAAGSVVRALEAVARDGARLGMHVVAASGRPDRTAGTAVAQAAALRAELSRSGDPAGDEEAIPGRGSLIASDGSMTAFQAGRVTGRIPRTSTQRPTVVPLDWTRAGDPPTSRPVRELGNGPTDLALLASAVGRAARSLGLDPQESGTSAAIRSRSGQDEVLES
uniref:FtsK/SpoIIIE domain-containing protein n=1 Tax=Streptomyces albidus (ex Kaewkla and Franco 2022) TaxID=722709 RepID=UPI0022A73CF6